MMEATNIREGEPGDLSAVQTLYPDAFPNEDLLPLVRELLQGRADVLSLVAILDSSLVGHVAFTVCGTTESNESIALLGPLAVASGWQRQGIGSALVKTGLQSLEKTGVPHVCVLGDPRYYRRFGFVPETRIAPPYPLPPEWREAWLSMSLGEAISPSPGELIVPELWRRPALWAR